jgi:hypothetical protein
VGGGGRFKILRIAQHLPIFLGLTSAIPLSCSCVSSNGTAMFHPRFHRDDNSLETLKSVTLERAGRLSDPTGHTLTTRSGGCTPETTPLVSRHARHATGSDPPPATKRKSCAPVPPGKRARATAAPRTVRLSQDVKIPSGKEPRSSHGATAVPLYVDHDFSLLPPPLHDLEDIALEGIDLEAPLPILTQSTKSSLKSSGEGRGDAHGILSNTEREFKTEESSLYKTPSKEPWKPVIDQLMWEPILTGGSSAFTPVTLPGSPRELIAVFTPPAKRALFDATRQATQSLAKSMSPCSRPAPMATDDDLDVRDELSVTEVVAV